MAVRQLKDGRWVVEYKARKDGKWVGKKEYFGRGPDAESKAIQRDEELGLESGRKKRFQGPKFYELAKPYVQNKNFSDYSKKHLKIRLEANILPFFGGRAAMGLTYNDMDAYVRKRTADGVKFSTIARELTDVKAILNWSVKRVPPMIPYNPVRDYQKPAPDDAIIMPPSPDEIRAILIEAPNHLVRAIKLSYYLGLRPGAAELFSLKWRLVSWHSKTIRVVAAKKGGPATRNVPIHTDFLAQLRRWYEEDRKALEKRKVKTGADDSQSGGQKKNDPIGELTIIHYHGAQIKKIQTTWENTLSRAGITRRLRPYDMRHYFVSTALEGGADIKALSEVVGSSPRTLIKHYQHVTREMHRNTVQIIPKLPDDD